MQAQIDRLAKIIWDYHHMGHKLKKADCILVLGSHDTRVAKRGAELFLEGWAPLLIFSGGLGNFTKGVWDESEAEKFSKIAIDMGVPIENILIENKSTNSGENILFTKKLLAEKGIDPMSFIAVQKPYMERRAFATFKKLWPEKDVIVTSPQIDYEHYPEGEITKEKVINIMVGDLQRIKEYPGRGFQIPQHIPEEVLDAYNHLIDLGYTNHMMRD